MTAARRPTEAEALAAVATDELELALAGGIEVSRARSAVRGAFAALAKICPRDNSTRFDDLMAVWSRWCDFASYLAAWDTEQRLIFGEMHTPRNSCKICQIGKPVK